MSPIVILLFLLWDVFVLAGTAYLVFWQGHSGWWFLLSLFLVMIPVSPSGVRGLRKEKKIRPIIAYPWV